MRTIQITGRLLLLTAFAAGCSDQPTTPTTLSDGGLTPEFSQALADGAAEADPYKDFLGASSYRLFFGHSGGSVAPNFSLTPSFGRAVPRDRADVLVNSLAGPGIGQSEVTIADRGGTIVAAWNDARGFFIFPDGVSGWGVSNDRGRNWTDGGSFPRTASPGFFHAGDPGLAVDNGGTFFFSDLCLDFLVSGVPDVCVTTGRATGGTVNWGTPVFAASTPADFLDKVLIAVDHQGNDVYVSFTRFSAATPFGQIEVAASHDGGATFAAPVVVGPAISLTVLQGSEPAVGPNGEVYVVWEQGWQLSGGIFPFFTPDIVVSKSTDGGATFSAPTTVTTIGSIFRPVPAGYNRRVINDFPRIDVARTGPHRGEVYVTFHSGVPGDGDIFVTHSPGGFSWNAPVLVNDDGLGAEQFWPDVVVEPGGNVSVMWYDRRVRGGSFTDTFWSQSTDGGATFRPNVRLSDVSTNWAATATDIRPNFGDYNALSAGGNRVYGAWGDGRLGTPDVFFSELQGVGKSP